MIRLNLPDYPLRIVRKHKQQWIFDSIRKKYVVLTPEEWVRQNFLQFLIQELEYPRSLIKVETAHKINNMDRRSDILVYDRSANPFLLTECKSAQVELSGKVFDQLSVYNQAVRANYLVITNGLRHYCCRLDYDSNSYEFQPEIPRFQNSLQH